MKVIAITGAAGYIGRRLIPYLERDPGVERVLAIDLRELDGVGEKVLAVCHDVREPMVELLLSHRVDTAVHLAFVVDPMYDRGRERAINVGGTERFLEACHAAGVNTALLASSSTAYGAWPDNPPLLGEDAPLRGKPGFPYVEDKLVLEELTRRFAAEHPACRVQLIRPTVVIGPNMDNYLSRFFLKPVSFAVRGVNPQVPLVHEDDVAEATWRLLAQGGAGAYNLNAPGPVPLEGVTRRLGARVLRLPPPMIYALAGLAWRLRLRALSEVPKSMIDYIRYPWVSDGTRVTRVTDFVYRFTGGEALDDFIRARRFE